MTGKTLSSIIREATGAISQLDSYEMFAEIEMSAPEWWGWVGHVAGEVERAVGLPLICEIEGDRVVVLQLDDGGD